MRSTREVMGIDVTFGRRSTRPNSRRARSCRRRGPCSSPSRTRTSPPASSWRPACANSASASPPRTGRPSTSPVRLRGRPRRRQGQRGVRDNGRRPHRGPARSPSWSTRPRAVVVAPTVSRSARRPTSTASATSPPSRLHSPPCRPQRTGRPTDRGPQPAGVPRPVNRRRRPTADRRRVDTAVSVGSVRLRGPVMTASGTAGHGTELAGALDLAALGAVVTKSQAPYEWAGNPAPRVHPTPLGMINAVGLQGHGVGALAGPRPPGAGGHRRHGGRQHLGPRGRRLPTGGGDAGRGGGERRRVEVNLSCPNLEGRRGIFAHDPDLSASVIEATAGCGGRDGRSCRPTPTASWRWPPPCRPRARRPSHWSTRSSAW